MHCREGRATKSGFVLTLLGYAVRRASSLPTRCLMAGLISKLQETDACIEWRTLLRSESSETDNS